MPKILMDFLLFVVNAFVRLGAFPRQGLNRTSLSRGRKFSACQSVDDKLPSYSLTQIPELSGGGGGKRGLQNQPIQFAFRIS